MEILIVLAIFSIISTITYTTLTRYLEITETLKIRSDQLSRIQLTFSWLERDLRYMVNRSVRDQYSETQDAFLVNNSGGIPGEILRVTSEQPDYRIPGGGNMHRIAWSLDDNSLSRNDWSKLDLDTSTNGISSVLLEDVSDFNLEIFNWTDQYGVQQDSFGSDQGQLPYGVKVTIILENGQEFSRLFDVANGS